MSEITATHGEIRAGLPFERSKDSHHNTQYCKPSWASVMPPKQVTPYLPGAGLGLTPLCHQSLSLAAASRSD